MFVAPPPSTGLRWAAYAAALTLMGLFAVQVLSAPKTPYQELRARVDDGWDGTYFDQTPLPASPTEPVPADDLTRIRGGSGGWESCEWRPFGPLTASLLAFLVLGLVGWLGSVFATRRPDSRHRRHRFGDAHA